MILIFRGRQGSGKGTYAQMLEKEFGIRQVSTGDMLREEICKETALGKQIAEIIHAGNLVPDIMVVQMLDPYLERIGLEKGVVIDGFPRTVEQCRMFDEMLEGKGLKVDLVLNFIASDEILLKRLATRWTCSKCNKIYNTL